MKDGSTLPRLLLHSCCAPCSTVALERLGGEYDVVVYFYGPNIHPKAEYELRLSDQRRLCERLGFELIVGPYRPAEWGRAILDYRHLPEGSLRCEACYRLRMRNTAELARRRGFDLFTVTLTVSRHKNSRVLERVGRQVAEETGVEYLAIDLKKKDGYSLSVKRSHQFGLYRQDYCGCSISLDEAKARRARREARAR